MSNVEPRRFSAFEELFLLRDRIDAPSSFFVKIELRDQLDPAKAQVALDTVSELHPLASSCVVAFSGRYIWQFKPEQVAIQWNEQRFSKVGYPTSWIDLSSQRPMNVSCFRGENGGTTILFQVHHVAFDGLGFLQLLRDWWSIYCGREADIPRYDSEKLNKRSRPSMSFLEGIRLLPGQWKSIRAATQVLGRTVIPFLPARELESPAPVVPGVVSRSFSIEATNSLRGFARSKNVSTNSVMASNLYISIEQWHVEKQSSSTGSHYRLVIPFNERTGEHDTMSACNHCTVISFDRRPEEMSDPDSLLASIDQEVHVIRRWRLSLNFWRALNLMRLYPGGLEKNASASRVTATSLFSNLGRLDRVSTLFANDGKESPAVSDFEVVPTLPHGMAIAIVAYELHGQIRLTMQYDRRVLDESTANGFMDQFMESNS